MKVFLEYIKKMNPTTQILLSFIGVILVGTILLSLPISNKQYSIGFINNLFIATSATCVTGLTPITIADVYTTFGQIVILIMIQIGGLGFITLFMFFLTSLNSRMSMRNKSLVTESLSIDTNFDITKMIRLILLYTFIFEGIGAILLATRFIPLYGPVKGLFSAIFISISAFCNAGFDNLGGNSLIGFVNDPIINLTIILLIIIGGIGFTVWFEVGNRFKNINKKEFSLKKILSKTNLHTKVVVISSIVLLVLGTLFTLVIEWNNALSIGNMNIFEKLLAALFTSTTLRTAGFATIDFAVFRPSLQFIMLLFMLTGGSPGGTAGGIKTTTLVTIIFASMTYLKGNKNIRIHNRQLGEEILCRAIAVVAMAICVLFISIIILLTTETSLTFMEIVFEAVSAFATVGLSLNVTARLSTLGKIIIIILMYCGRVGVLTLGVAFMNQGRDAFIENEIQYPEENILIG